MTLANLIATYHERAKEEGGATDQGLADFLEVNGVAPQCVEVKPLELPVTGALNGQLRHEFSNFMAQRFNVYYEYGLWRFAGRLFHTREEVNEYVQTVFREMILDAITTRSVADVRNEALRDAADEIQGLAFSADNDLECAKLDGLTDATYAVEALITEEK